MKPICFGVTRIVGQNIRASGFLRWRILASHSNESELRLRRFFHENNHQPAACLQIQSPHPKAYSKPAIEGNGGPEMSSVLPVGNCGNKPELSKCEPLYPNRARVVPLDFLQVPIFTAFVITNYLNSVRDYHKARAQSLPSLVPTG